MLRCQQGHMSGKGPRRGSFLPLLASGGLGGPWACGSITLIAASAVTCLGLFYVCSLCV